MRTSVFALYDWSGVQGGREGKKGELAGKEQGRTKRRKEGLEWEKERVRGEGRKGEKERGKILINLESLYSHCLSYDFVSGLEAILEELHLI